VGVVDLPSLWNLLKGQIYLGGDTVLQQMQALSPKGDLSEITRIQRRPLAKSLEYYRDTIPNRREAMAIAYAAGNYTMQ